MRTLLPAFFAWTGCSSKSFSDSSAERASTIVHTMTQRITAIREYTQDNNPLRVLVVGSQYDSECRNIRTLLVSDPDSLMNGWTTNAIQIACRCA